MSLPSIPARQIGTGRLGRFFTRPPVVAVCIVATVAIMWIAVSSMIDEAFSNVDIVFAGPGCENTSVTIGPRVFDQDHRSAMLPPAKYPVLVQSPHGMFVGVLFANEGESYPSLDCTTGQLTGEHVSQMVAVKRATVIP